MSWIVLALLLAVALYTAAVIRGEKSRHTRQGQWKSFGDYRLLIPPWWTPMEETAELLRFERTDTYYDWMARFQRRPCPPELDLEGVARRECARMEVEFDSDHLQRIKGAPFVQDGHCRKKLAPHSLRLEGTAQQFETERCHLDLFIVKHPGRPYFDLFYSWSSVLHGLVEGPYFDEVLKKIKLVGE